MNLLHWINPLFTLSGFCVSALVGLTGIGGGSLMTPILFLLFGVHPATAVGTDLLYAGTTQAGGTFVHSVYRCGHGPNDAYDQFGKYAELVTSGDGLIEIGKDVQAARQIASICGIK